MRSHTRTILAFVAVVSGLLSLVSLMWWLVHSYVVIAEQGGLQWLKQINPELVSQADPSQLFLFNASNYFSVLGGVVGWAALIRLYTLAGRPLGQLPKWLFIGLLIGTAAAIALPYGGVYAYPPIVAAVALLVRCHLSAPNQQLNRTRADDARAG